jgi:hypothetical protein
MSSAVCVACRHSIDAAARLCPYCGANPQTGEKVDTEAMLREVFKPKEMTTSESVIEYARHRQGIVLFVGLALAFLVLAALHQYVTMRNNSVASGAPAVPLSDVADISNQAREPQQLPMPKLDFQFEGRAQSMRTFIVEPGAVAPAPPQPPPAPAPAPAR